MINFFEKEYCSNLSLHLYVCMCVCVCVCAHIDEGGKGRGKVRGGRVGRGVPNAGVRWAKYTGRLNTRAITPSPSSIPPLNHHLPLPLLKVYPRC